MGKVLWVLYQLVLYLLMWVVGWFPWLGLLFTAGMVVGTVAWLGFDNLAVTGWLLTGGVVYAVVVPLTFLLLATFRYQHCCLGIQRLGRHLAHSWPRGHVEDVAASLAWPVSWFWLQQSLRMWGLTFSLVVYDVCHYWLVDYWLHRAGKPGYVQYTWFDRH